MENGDDKKDGSDGDNGWWSKNHISKDKDKNEDEDEENDVKDDPAQNQDEKDE